jgi:hypothetical protein
MCCGVVLAALIGPRLGVVVWYLLDASRWASAFHSMWLWPILGFFFLPWTTIGYVLAAPGGVVSGWGWAFVIVGFLLDSGSWGGGYRTRTRTVVVRDPN